MTFSGITSLGPGRTTTDLVETVVCAFHRSTEAAADLDVLLVETESRAQELGELFHTDCRPQLGGDQTDHHFTADRVEWMLYVVPARAEVTAVPIRLRGLRAVDTPHGLMADVGVGSSVDHADRFPSVHHGMVRRNDMQIPAFDRRDTLAVPEDEVIGLRDREPQSHFIFEDDALRNQAVLEIRDADLEDGSLDRLVGGLVDRDDDIHLQVAKLPDDRLAVELLDLLGDEPEVHQTI